MLKQFTVVETTFEQRRRLNDLRRALMESWTMGDDFAYAKACKQAHDLLAEIGLVPESERKSVAQKKIRRSA